MSPSSAAGACRIRGCDTVPTAPSSEYLRLRRAERRRWSAKPPCSESLLPELPLAVIEIPQLSPGYHFLEVPRRGFASANLRRKMRAKHGIQTVDVLGSELLHH